MFAVKYFICAYHIAFGCSQSGETAYIMAENSALITKTEIFIAWKDNTVVILSGMWPNKSSLFLNHQENIGRNFE